MTQDIGMTPAHLPVEMKLRAGATPPRYASEGAAGCDFHAYCPEGAVVVAPGETRKISLGVALFIGTPRWALQLMPRSGLGSKGIILANTVGLIDSDYQGELVAMVYNRSGNAFTVSHGDRICQGVFVPVEQAAFKQVVQFSTETRRGEGGFGSTGGSALRYKGLASC